MIKKKVEFIAKCDSFGCQESITIYVSNFVEELRFKKWAVARDRKTCYCPNCREYYAAPGTKNRWKKEI